MLRMALARQVCHDIFLSLCLNPRFVVEESLDFAMRPGDVEFWLFTETGKLCLSGKRRW